MELGNFNDPLFITFFVILILVGIAILFSTVMLSIQTIREKKFKKDLSFESRSTFVYTIYVKDNKVISFNKSDMRHKVTSDLVYFYNMFHPNDVDNIKNWIFSICVDSKQTNQYIEADILLNNKKPCFSLLKLLKYDTERSVITLEGHILKYITPNNMPRAKVGKNKMRIGIVKRSEIMQIINKNKSLNGYTFGIRFFYPKQKTLSNDKVERHMLMTLKNAIYPFASAFKTPRQILDEGGNELFLFDTKITNRENAMQFASSIEHTLKMQMEVNGFSGYISFAIGIVENGQYYQDFDTILECAREACITGQTNGKLVTFHRRNVGVQSDMSLLTDQINHLIRGDSMRFLFRPIIDVSKGQIIGYFEYVKVYDSPFSDFQEMSKYASKINRNADLFATVAKRVVPKFVSEIQEEFSSLFLSISMSDIEYINDIVDHIPEHEKANIVYVFDEQEVNENAESLELLSNSLHKLVDSGHQAALLLKDKQLLLDDSVYRLFSHFIVGSTMLKAIRQNNRMRLSTYTLIESLLQYNKPIIATDLENWEAVELIIESGIKYLSSEVIAPSNDMLLPLNKKKIEKVNAMAVKYL